MPDVGTLNLTIESNAGKATGGLVKLADALTRVKQAVGTGIGLSKVAEEVTTLAKTIQDARGTSTIVKNLGTMFNAINQFSKLKNFTIDTEKIRSTAENMLKLAEAKERVDAATKSTAGVSDWRSSMNTIASDTKKAVVSVQDSINQYENIIKDFTEDSKGSGYLSRMAGMGVFATSMPRGSRSRGTMNSEGQISMDLDGTLGKIKETVSQMNVVDAVVTKVTEHVSTATNQFSSFFDSERMIEPYKKIADQMHEAEKTSLGYANAIGAILPKVNQHNSELMIEAGNARLAAMSEQALATAIAEAQGLLQRSRPAELLIQTEQIQSAEQFNIVLNETGDIVTSVLIPRFQEMYETWSMMAYEFGAFQMQAARLVGGDSPLLLGDGRTPGQLMLGDGTEAETFLSTWVQAGETFKTNWVDFTSDVAAQWRTMWSPDWILGGWQTPVSMSSFHLGQGDSPLLLGDGGVSPDEMLSTWIDTSEQWKQNWTVGEGTVSDAIDDTQQVAAATREAAESAEDYGTKFASILEAKREEAELAERIRAQQEESFYAVKPTVSMEQTNAMADNLTQLDLLQAKLREAEEKYNEYVNTLGAGSAKTIKAGLDVQNLRDAIWEYKQALEGCADGQEEAANSASWLSTAWDGLKGGITRMFPTLTSLLKRFKSMMIMRSLRYVIRSLSKGFSEGVQNVYQYSKAVGTSFAPTMDQAATAMQQLKNSIGAAVAPVIQTLIPVLQTVVNWVISGINYLNQFFALLNGQATWTRALPEAAEAFEKNTKAAKGSSKAMKDLLADWDELNIIQSNSNSGGGSGTGKTAEEYSNMFEEVNEFDQQVKDTVSIITDALGGIPGLLTKAGIALLGWKFSKGFTGWLGKLGKIVAGAALVTIGVELSYGSGFDAGTKGYFDTVDIVGAVGGSIAAALGGSLITSAVGLGGMPGIAIGLTVGIVATLYGYMKGNAKAKDAVKWGNLHMTAEEVKKYVRDQFTFDVDAEISALHTNINDIEGAKEEANAKIAEFEKTLNAAVVNVSLGVDADPNGTTVKDAVVAAQAAVSATQDQITQTNASLEVGLKYLPYINESGKDDSENFLENIMIDEKPITKYMNDMGRELADALYAGEKAGWDEKTTKAALDLLASQQEMWNEYKRLSKQYQLDADLQEAMNGVVNNGTIDKETAENALQEQENILSEYKETAYAEAKAEADALRDMAAKAQAMANDALKKGDETTAKELEDSANDLLEQANSRIEQVGASIDAKLAETKENISRQWVELIRKVYGADIDTSTTKYTAGSDRDSFIKYVLKGMNEGGIGKASENMISTIANLLGFTDPDWFVKNLIDDNVVSVFDLLGKETREALFHSLEEQFGTDTAYDIFRTAFDLTRGDIDLIAFPEGNIPENINDDLEDAIEEYIDLDAEAEVPITITPVIDMDETINELKKYIDFFLSDELLAKWELDKLYDKFGQDLVTKTLEDMGLELKEADLLPNGDYQYHMNGGLRPAAMLASGIQEYNGRATPYTEPQIGTSMLATESMAGDVAKGTAQGNESQNDLIRQLITLATRIANKEFTVNITPSSAWGNHNAQSNAAYEKVTG